MLRISYPRPIRFGAEPHHIFVHQTSSRSRRVQFLKAKRVQFYVSPDTSLIENAGHGVGCPEPNG